MMTEVAGVFSTIVSVFGNFPANRPSGGGSGPKDAVAMSPSMVVLTLLLLLDGDCGVSMVIAWSVGGVEGERDIVELFTTKGCR